MTRSSLSPIDNRASYRRAFVSLIFLGLVAVPIILIAATFDLSGRSSLVLTGVLCLLAIGYPMMLPGRPVKLYEPIIPMSISVLIGSTLRSFYLAYSEAERVPALMMSQTYFEIAERSLWLILALFAIGTGYAATRVRLPVENMRFIFDREFKTGKRLHGAVLASIVIVSIGTFLFIDAYGITFALDAISGKRTASIITDDGQEVFTSLGYIRIMSEIGASAFYYFVAIKLYHGKKFTPISIAFLAFLFVISAAIPFLSSSRSEVGVIIINSVILFAAFGRVNVRLLLTSSVVILAIIFGMSQLRDLSQGGGNRENESIIDAVVGSANFVDIGRTSAILDKVPQNTDFLYGKSYLSLITAPIPKVLWPEKPNPSMGPWIRSEVFGVWTRNNGWPPNIVSEAYINFGYWGYLLPCLLFGAIVRIVYNSFSKLIPENPIAILIYVSIYWSIGIKIIQLNFAQGVMIGAQSLISMILFILIASSRRPRQSGTRSAERTGVS